MDYERRSATGTVEVHADESGSMAVGYASVFDSTSHNLGGFVERVAPGAFKKTLGEQDVVGLWNHDQSALLGRVSAGTLRLEEDGHGLRYEIDLPDTTLGRDLAVSLGRGDVVGSSFGFRTIEDAWGETDSGFPLRTLREVALVDVSPVTTPAYPESAVALRCLADARGLPLVDVEEAAAANRLQDLLDDDGRPEEPSETHPPGLSLGAFIR